MFTAFQQKLFGAALACLSIFAIGAFVVLLFALLSAFLSKFGTVVAPVAAALILSFILSPLVDFVSRRAHVSASAACGIVCIAAAAVAAALAAFVLPRAVSEIGEICGELPSLAERAAHNIAERYPESRETLRGYVAEMKRVAAEHASFAAVAAATKKVLETAVAATGGLVSFFSFLAAFAVVPIYLYYMLTSNFDFYSKLEKNLAFASPSVREDIVFFVRRFSEIMSAFFRGQLLIALIMGALYGVGFLCVGVSYGFLLGFFAGILNLVPYLGTVVGLGTILPVALLQADGGWLTALAALGVFCAVQCLEGYVLTPRIMGDRTGLHPTVIIFSVFFWGIALGGILGMILAIPLTAFAAAAWDRLLQRRFSAEASVGSGE